MKVNIGRQTGKKSNHKLPVSVTTTSQFGFCQPFYCRESAAQDSYKIRQAAAVRLMPVVKPTFGRLFLKEFTSYIPMEEIWHPWGSFLAGKPYQGALSHYVPTYVPSTKLSTLCEMNYFMSQVQVWKLGTYGVLNDNGFSCRPDAAKLTSLDVFGQSYQDLIAWAFAGVSDNTNYTKNLASWFYDKGFLKFDLTPTDSELYNQVGQYDYLIPFRFKNEVYLFAGRYTLRGKNFNKILVGLGYQASYIQDFKSVLPFWAFYKMYFDLFAPQRQITWKDTRAYKVMEYIEQSNSYVTAIINNFDLRDDILSFFAIDLPTVYYTQDTDFAAAHISGTGISESPVSMDYLSPSNDGTEVSSRQVQAGMNNQPVMVVSNGAGVTQQALDILKAMYQRVNISTAVGGKIKEFMQAIFGSDYKQEDESNFIGSNTVNIDITDVMSTAETSEGYLGEFAGKGIGFDPAGKSFAYTCRAAGYVISMFAIIPEARLAQAVDPNLSHIYKMDFFQDKFDALTLLPTRKDAIFGQSDVVLPDVNGLRLGFGNIPNFTEYKVSFDKLNGDIILRSTRDQLLPFSIAKYIQPSLTQVFPGNTPALVVKAVQSDFITEGTIWRYIGRDRWLGNFDRIFVNQGYTERFLTPDATPDTDIYANLFDDVNYRQDDNFVVYLYCDITVNSFALPLADSFQTDAFGDHLAVQKQ